MTSQAAILAPFRVMNRYVGNVPAMPGVVPDYPAPVGQRGRRGRDDAVRWGVPLPRTGGPPATKST